MADSRHDDSQDADLVRARLAAIVDSSDDVIVSKTLDGIITTWNPAAERMFGWTSAEAVGRHITLIIPEERRSEEDEVLARIRRGDRVDHFETMRITKDRRLLNVSITVSPVRDGRGRIVGASKIARDISERLRAEAEREFLLARERDARKEAEAANRAKDDFLATLSHELRTPINAILGWAQVLGTAQHDTATVSRALETIIRNAKQQARLIDDLLDLSAVVGGRLRLNSRSVNLVTALGAALETIRPDAERKGVAIRARLDPVVVMVSGDPERLQQVFWNLLSNAVKFTARHGHVELRLERDGSHAVVTVSDTGIGLRADLVDAIFERFRQADGSIARAHGGLGLGLAIVRQLVELHGGTVEAASPGEGQGATFTVTLPLALEDAPRGGESVEPTSGAVRPCEGTHALLVDDEDDGRGMVTVLLEQGGARVTAVTSASEALAVMRRIRPDVIISDLAMPAMDGYELIRQVRSSPNGRRVPAIALTGHVTADARIKTFQAGFDAYVAKPVDRDELLAIVARLAGRAGAEPPG